MLRDSWNPAQYDRFKTERQLPFWDLLHLVQPGRLRAAVDLGCGTGELTSILHDRLAIGSTSGIDRSAAMLAKALPLAKAGLAFHEGQVEEWQAPAGVDLVFSNATLQWTEDHAALFPRLLKGLRPDGQFAVQMPSNHDHISHRLAAEIAASPRFRTALNGFIRVSPVQPAENYAELLYKAGCKEQHIGLKVYGHVLPSSADVVEWVKGTMLTDYETRLSPGDFQDFLAVYHQQLAAALGTSGPYFYAFKRLLIWGRV